jgi:hypothetical protein
MLSPEESRVALRKLFQQRRVADLPLLLKTLRTDAPRSVFRRLSLVGYVCSYNQNGRYYTLTDIPEFDAHGLWQHHGVFFSKHGTLKATITKLVEVSDSGHTHGELEVVLRVRVHNMLLDLVKSGRLGRELLEGLFLYVSAKPDRAAAQLAHAQVARRQAQQIAVPAIRVAETKPSLVIEVLLEVIHGARVVPDPDVVRARLAMRSVSVGLEQVVDIFRTYGLKKTAGSRSTRSRR